MTMLIDSLWITCWVDWGSGKSGGGGWNCASPSYLLAMMVNGGPSSFFKASRSATGRSSISPSDWLSSSALRIASTLSSLALRISFPSICSNY